MKQPVTCDRTEVPARVRAVMEERPLLSHDFVRPYRPGHDVEKGHLVVRLGAAAKVDGEVVLRVVPEAVYVMPSADQAQIRGIDAGRPVDVDAVAKGVAEQLGSMQDVGDRVALAFDESVSNAMVVAVVDGVRAAGVHTVQLLFEKKNPTTLPAAPEGSSPESFGPEVDAAMAKCPGLKAVLHTEEATNAEVGVAAAKVLEGCPCDADVGMLELAIEAMAGEVPLTGVDVALAPGDDVPALELSSMGTWASSNFRITRAAAKGPVRLALNVVTAPDAAPAKTNTPEPPPAATKPPEPAPAKTKP